MFSTPQPLRRSNSSENLRSPSATSGFSKPLGDFYNNNSSSSSSGSSSGNKRAAPLRRASSIVQQSQLLATSYLEKPLKPHSLNKGGAGTAVTGTVRTAGAGAAGAGAASKSGAMSGSCQFLSDKTLAFLGGSQMFDLRVTNNNRHAINKQPATAAAAISSSNSTLKTDLQQMYQSQNSNRQLITGKSSCRIVQGNNDELIGGSTSHNASGVRRLSVLNSSSNSNRSSSGSNNNKQLKEFHVTTTKSASATAAAITTQTTQTTQATQTAAKTKKSASAASVADAAIEKKIEIFKFAALKQPAAIDPKRSRNSTADIMSKTTTGAKAGKAAEAGVGTAGAGTVAAGTAGAGIARGSGPGTGAGAAIKARTAAGTIPPKAVTVAKPDLYPDINRDVSKSRSSSDLLSTKQSFSQSSLLKSYSSFSSSSSAAAAAVERGNRNSNSTLLQITTAAAAGATSSLDSPNTLLLLSSKSNSNSNASLLSLNQSSNTSTSSTNNNTSAQAAAAASYYSYSCCLTDRSEASICDSVCDSMLTARSICGVAPTPPPQDYMNSRRPAVSSESVSMKTLDAWTPPLYRKTAAEEARIREHVFHHLRSLFGHLTKESEKMVVSAMFKKFICKSTVLIKQGDEGDNFYLVDEGLFYVLVTNAANGETMKVQEVSPGMMFGELALMYSSPRAATCIAVEDSVVWALDRMTFRMLLVASENFRKQIYESLIEKIAIFQCLSKYERSQLCDLLTVKECDNGVCIYREGEKGGDRFYIVESGLVVCKVKDANGIEVPIQHYTRGGYFGELALLTEHRIQDSSVYTVGSSTRLLWIGKSTFERVLGPMLDLLKKDAERFSRETAAASAKEETKK